MGEVTSRGRCAHEDGIVVRVRSALGPCRDRHRLRAWISIACAQPTAIAHLFNELMPVRHTSPSSSVANLRTRSAVDHEAEFARVLQHPVEQGPMHREIGRSYSQIRLNVDHFVPIVPIKANKSNIAINHHVMTFKVR